ncbi:MAG: hypothetical protein KJO91_01160, partial [Gammaproteobacteria bacterium]|nr:hypothetical protein [Gammaproteobacteria bacterium]
LWYAVSGNYKSEPESGLINEDTNGVFQIVDAAAAVQEDDVVAVIFAPGTAFSGQVRNIDVDTHCGEDYGNPIAYLEGNGATDNANLQDVEDSPDQFIQASLTSAAEPVPYNDYLITITRAEIWQAIMSRSDLQNRFSEVTEALAQCLAEYVNHADNPNKRFPWPAKLDLDGADYRVMANYSDKLNATAGYAGRIPFNIDDSNAVIVTSVEDNYLDPLNDPPVAGTDICFDMNLAISGVNNINLTDEDSEHRIILNNWKDHFFYAVSKDYALPDTGAASCSGDCVSIENPAAVFTSYAAIVFFSGSPYAGQLRDNANKDNVAFYLENGNAGDFTDAGGNGVYSTASADPAISNDIMFCLTDQANPAVVAC